MSARPFFSICIPSKNRPDRLRDAVQSVIAQSFQDFEVVVCDNSDDAEAAATAAAVRTIADPRVVYVRTNGRLSMPDNWERAVAEAQGEYVGILTDRSMFLPFALERAHQQIAATGVPVVGWFGDSYGRGPTGKDFRRRDRTGRAWLVESRRLLDYFLHGHPKLASKRLPKLMTSVCARSVIETVTSSALGRMCPPVCPDYTSGYLMLAHTERIVLIDDALYLSCGSGNGSSFRRRGALADRFMRDLGMSWQDLVDRMPTRACFTSALVLNDLMRLKEQLPDRFQGYDIDRVQYFISCLADYEKAARRGAELFEDYDELIEGLNAESPDVQARVRTSQIYVRAATTLPPETGARVRGAAGDDEDASPLAEFASVAEVVEWSVRNRFSGIEEPAATEGPLPMPPLEDVHMATIKRKRVPVPWDTPATTEQR